MKRICVLFLHISIYLFIACTPQPAVTPTGTASDKPNWVESPKLDTLHYYGVGASDYYLNSGQTLDISIQNAIAQISAQIWTSIQSSSTDSVWEDEGWIGQSYQRVIKMHTENLIKDWEIMDHWTDSRNGSVWTLARLSKELYRSQKRQQQDQFISIAYQNLRSLDTQLAHESYTGALNEILSGLYHTRLLFGDKAVVEYPKYSGIQVDITSALKQRARNFLENVEIRVTEQPDVLIGGISNNKRIVIQSGYRQGYRTTPMANIPLLISFGKDCIQPQSITTNEKGEAVWYCQKVPAYTNHMQITIGIDFNGVPFEKGNKEFPSEIDYNRLLPNNSVSLEIPVRSLKFCVLARERIKGYDVPDHQRFVSTAVKKALTDSLNASFTPYQTQADYIINIDVNAVYSSKMQYPSGALIVYRANAKVDLLNPLNHETLYTFHLENAPREAGLSESVAAENTLRKTAIYASDQIVAQLLEYFGRQE